MINVTIGTNTNRKKVIVSKDSTLREVLESNNVNLSVGTIFIDGQAISFESLGKTLNELGVTDNAYILSVQKADNAR